MKFNFHIILYCITNNIIYYFIIFAPNHIIFYYLHIYVSQICGHVRETFLILLVDQL